MKKNENKVHDQLKEGGQPSSVWFMTVISPVTAVPMVRKYFYISGNFLNGLFQSIHRQTLTSYRRH
jgi:hypothetical protein